LISLIYLLAFEFGVSCMLFVNTDTCRRPSTDLRKK